MFETSARQAINMADAGKCLEHVGRGITLGDDIDFGAFIQTFQFGNQRRHEDHVAQTVIRPTDQNAINLVPWYDVGPGTGRK
ncbi:hypothetical protein [Rhodanobacter sp. BL-MT-08]